MGVGDHGSLDDLVPRRGFAALTRGNVVVHGAAEKCGFLLDDANLLAQPHRVEVADVDTVEGDGASLRIPAVNEHAHEVVARGLLAGRRPDARVIETLDELHGGGLSTATLADERDGLTGRCDEVEAAEHRGLALRVTKFDPFELDASLEIVRGDDEALATLLRLRGGFWNGTTLCALLHGAGVAVHEGLGVDGGNPVDEGKDAVRG